MARRIVHGRHFSKSHYTKCGKRVSGKSWNYLDEAVVNTSAISSITCKACLKANDPGKV